MADKPTEEKILIPDEVALLLRVKVDTLYRWRLAGDGPQTPVLLVEIPTVPTLDPEVP